MTNCVCCWTKLRLYVDQDLETSGAGISTLGPLGPRIPVAPWSPVEPLKKNVNIQQSVSLEKKYNTIHRYFQEYTGTTGVPDHG